MRINMPGTMLEASLLAPPISPARRSWRRYRAGILFVLPALILYLVFMVYPFFQSIYFSLTSWNGVTAVKEWVGFANYGKLMGDGLFWKSLLHTVIWVIIGTIAPIVVGMLLAILLWRRPKGFTLFRTIFFILNEALDAVGLEDLSRGWLGDPDVALYAVLAAAIWATIGFVFVILL